MYWLRTRATGAGVGSQKFVLVGTVGADGPSEPGGRAFRRAHLPRAHLELRHHAKGRIVKALAALQKPRQERFTGFVLYKCLQSWMLRLKGLDEQERTALGCQLREVQKEPKRLLFSAKVAKGQERIEQRDREERDVGPRGRGAAPRWWR